MATEAATAQFLGEAWFERVGALAKAASLPSALTARVQGVISGGPDGEVRCRLVFDGGRLAAPEIGVVDDADLTLTVVYDDAVAVQQGELEPTVAFMQGRMKSTGDPGRVLQVLSMTATPEYRELHEQVSAFTRY